MAHIRFLAEWESCESILMALPHADTDWNYMLPKVQQAYRDMVDAFTHNGEKVVMLFRDVEEAQALFADLDRSSLTLIESDYNDTWTRDYGPISVDRDDRLRALDFGFNGWGLKFAADRDNLVNLHLHEKSVMAPHTYRNERDFVLEGGSVETDGQGTLLTTSRCLCSPNRNGGLTRHELNEILHTRLGVDHVLWLDYGELAGDDTDSHIDTLARICPDNTIAFTGCHDENEQHFESLLHLRAQLSMFRNAEGDPYNLLELPLPDPIYDEEGFRLPATYANYLVTPRNLFMPIYGQPQNDELACRTIKIAFPEHNVVPVDATALICQHGSLHCATMQIPESLFNPVIYER